MKEPNERETNDTIPTERSVDKATTLVKRKDASVAGKRKSRWGIIVFVVIIAALVLAFVLFTKQSLSRKTTSATRWQSLKDISQLATLEFRYQDVISIIEEEDFKMFGIWDIDPGEHILIVQFDGIIKLGIDCEKLLFNEKTADDDGIIRVEIKLPPVELISSETPLSSFQVVVNKGVFTKTTVDIGVFFDEAAKLQDAHNTEALQGEMGKTARENAKRQLQAILESIQEIRDNYEIVWYE